MMLQSFADAVGGKHRVIGGPFGSKLTQAHYVADGVPVIRGRNMDLGREIAGDFVFVSHEKFAQDLTTNTARPGDIIVTQRGTLGQVAIVPDSSYKQYVVSQSQMAVSVDQKVADRDFVYHYLTSSFFLEYIKTSTIQTGVPHINLGILRDAPVLWPDRHQQRAIATVLSALDEKIELNRRMNETLEASARALFRDWFVDFGPTRAKAEGRPAYLAPDLWSLFPDRLGENGVPEGWEWGTLNEVLVLQRGFDLPKGDRTDGAFPVIAASGPSGTHNEKRVDGPGVCTGRSGVLGGVYYVAEDFWPLNTSLWIKEYPNSTPLHAFHVLLEIDIGSFNAGSAVPTLNRNHIHNLPVVKPPMVAILAFDKIAGELYAKREANIAQAATLAATRDALLPKLMSGELRVRDAKALAA
ncbi:restriction endonuclease subunit S [Sphingomonas sp.]|uniref:restriction endonuclease subunit S n=1 Tax=Sphingomonas sp. TaxID=28214 RepID=UPI0031D02C0E